MKTPYVDPLIPLHETSDETLMRLSANIGTLTALVAEAERRGQIYLAGMFSRSRGAKVAEAKAMIATLAAHEETTLMPEDSPVAEQKTPAWKDAERELHDGGELVHAGAEEFVIERRFLLVGNTVSDSSALALAPRDQLRRQLNRRSYAPHRFLPALTDPRFFQLALA